jgi:DNA-binding HxlR family transcriptional regulator
MSTKADISAMNCSLARALSIVGDPWAILIVRDALLGATRFAQFHASLGMARNVLTQRLGTLVKTGVLERRGTQTRPTYHLSEMGFELVPVLIGLMQWGDKWLSSEGSPMIFATRDGHVLAPIRLRTSDGLPVMVGDLTVQAGAGADSRTRLMLETRAAETRN